MEDADHLPAVDKGSIGGWALIEVRWNQTYSFNFSDAMVDTDLVVCSSSFWSLVESIEYKKTEGW